MAERAPIKLPFWKTLGPQLRRKLRGRRAGAITALDVDGHLLRVVQSARRGNRPAITRIQAERLDFAAGADRANPSVIGQAIAATLARMRIKPGAVVMGVPRALVVLRTLSIPRVDDPRELASMVHFQIAKDLPFRLEDAVIDFKVRRQTIAAPAPQSNGNANGAEPRPSDAAAPGSAKLEVLVAAARRQVVEFYGQLAAAAGINLAGLGWLSCANARCVEACRIAEGNETVALVSLRPDEAGVDIVGGHSLLFSRGARLKLPHDSVSHAPILPEQPEKPEDAGTADASGSGVPKTFVEAVTIEVVRSFHSYGGIEPHPPVAKLVVGGGTGHEMEVVEALQQRLKIPCSFLDPAAALDLPKPAREHACGSISALGLAFGAMDPHGLPFDFLHPKRPAVQRNMRRIRIMTALAAASTILLILVAVRARLVNERLQVQRAVQAELAEAEKKRPIYRQMRQQAATVQGWANQSGNWLDHYAYLSAILPSSEQIYISSITMNAPGHIRLSVQARSGQVLAAMEKQLRAAGYEIRPVAITPGADKFGYSFRSSVELIVPDKMEIDLSKVQPPARPADDASLDPPNPARQREGS